LVRDCLVEHDLAFLVEDVRLVASEFVTSAVVHARTPLRLRLQGSAEQVGLTVRHYSKRMPVAVSTSFMSNRGRGLALVGSYASDWGVTNGMWNAKSVWAVFDLVQRAPRLLPDDERASVSGLPPESTGRRSSHQGRWRRNGTLSSLWG
jgi:hypothetical protein